MALSKKDMDFHLLNVAMLPSVAGDIFMGIDQKPSKAQFAFIDNSGTLLRHIEAPTTLGGAHMLGQLQTSLSQAIKIMRPSLVMIEGYAYGAKFYAHQMGEVGGVLKLILLKNNLPFFAPSPTQVKQYCLGKGRGQKSQILKGVLKKWNVDCHTDDEADALILAHMGRDLFNYQRENNGYLREYEKEILDKVLNPSQKTRRKGVQENVS